MAINFETANPQALLAAFKKAIDEGHVVTWSYDANGNFTHTPSQWKDEAVLRPSIYTGWLVMNFYRRKSDKTSPGLYAVYHGRFIESMLAHCDKLFSNGTATSMPTNADRLAA
ncbi:MAG TPA: hypothetical protein VGV41_10170 [Pseudolabrys sp.]|uniref:hypothetical protein n=1 Tax=Pseudolabrys sp. TaxID=1960880 RepID=UPI002DDD5D4E|nr:hypothetical protein [Pseudolabrys sp.]HEV2628996.1 hypothetical protein [Pseudolabrys sp.]